MMRRAESFTTRSGPRAFRPPSTAGFALKANRCFSLPSQATMRFASRWPSTTGSTPWLWAKPPCRCWRRCAPACLMCWPAACAVHPHSPSSGTLAWTTTPAAILCPARTPLPPPAPPCSCSAAQVQGTLCFSSSAAAARPCSSCLWTRASRSMRREPYTRPWWARALPSRRSTRCVSTSPRSRAAAWLLPRPWPRGSRCWYRT